MGARVYLVDEGTLVLVLIIQHLGPQLEVLPVHEELGLRLVERIVVGDRNRLIVCTLFAGISAIPIAESCV